MRRRVVVFSCVAASFAAGMFAERARARPSRPLAPVCCAEERPDFVSQLATIVGAENVLTGGEAFNQHMRGMRIGNGAGAAVVRPGTLAEAVKVVELCAGQRVPVFPQGANTGLTGGSVSRDEKGVCIDMRRLNRIVPLNNDASLVLTFAGAGIHDLSTFLADYNRDSHTLLGSSFLNPTVGAGIALGSGGVLIRKGPVFTERLLYVRINSSGQVELVNTLDLEEKGLSILEQLDSGDVLKSASSKRQASGAAEYARELAQNNDSVARSNSSPGGSPAAKSEGHALILVSVHDTWAKPLSGETLIVATDRWETCRELRSLLLASPPSDLPSSLEYMNKAAVEVVDDAGRALCLSLGKLGVGPTLARLWTAKQFFEGWTGDLTEKLLFEVNKMLPDPLGGGQLSSIVRSKEHVIIIQNDDFNGSRARLRKRLDEFVQSAPADSIVLHECKTPDEIRRIKNFRFAAAPAFRTFCIGKRLHGVSFDFALPKNYEHSVILEPEGEEMEVKMMYGHFGCAVYHYDVAIKGGEREAASLKKGMVNAVEQVGGKLPAEHGFGTEYTAPPGTVARWKEVDPTNMFNPGVGKTTNLPNWKE